MASEPKLAANAPSQTRPGRERGATATQSAARAGTTRDAVREIVRRYRETFERLGR